MPAITDDQIDGLLCEAERRLQGQAPAAYPSSTAAHMNALEVVASSKPAAAPSEKLAIRTASSTLPTDATQTQVRSQHQLRSFAHATVSGYHDEKQPFGHYDTQLAFVLNRCRVTP